MHELRQRVREEAPLSRRPYPKIRETEGGRETEGHTERGKGEGGRPDHDRVGDGTKFVEKRLQVKLLKALSRRRRNDAVPMFQRLRKKEKGKGKGKRMRGV